MVLKLDLIKRQGFGESTSGARRFGSPNSYNSCEIHAFLVFSFNTVTVCMLKEHFVVYFCFEFEEMKTHLHVWSLLGLVPSTRLNIIVLEQYNV